MDLSIPAYFLVPGCALLFSNCYSYPMQPLLLTTWSASWAVGTFRATEGALRVWIDWSACSWECLIILICLAVSYHLLSHAEPL
jgi:hypothetical protein